MSDCSDVSTWSSCTGRDGLGHRRCVSPSASSGDAGVPGCRSTKKLPSRKMRGRIFTVASLWIGSALVVELHRHDGGVGRVLARSIFLTLPTLTPAMRTGEFVPDRCWPTRRRALTPEAVRERDVLGEAEVRDRDEHDEHDRADRRDRGRCPVRGLARAWSLCRSVGTGSPFVFVGRRCPGCRARCRSTVLPGVVVLVARLALLGLARARPCSGTGWCAGSCPARRARWRAPRTGRPRCSGPAARRR